MSDRDHPQRLGGPPVPDWGLGKYESTASQLLPAARVAVEAARLQPGERVLDVGCGTGNAALLAVEDGADVMGVDPADRLLDVARARAANEGKSVTFESGHAAALPVVDNSADAVVSVFGVVFAPDAVAVATELDRVVAPSGRLVLTAWMPGGPIGEMNAAAAEAVRDALRAPAPTEPFPWHDRDSLAELFGLHGFSVETVEHTLAFTASSAEAYLAAERTNHPLAVAGFRVLDQQGHAESVAARLLSILEEGNEVDDGFQVTSRYVVARLHRSGS